MIRLAVVSLALGFLLGSATGNVQRIIEERRSADAGVGAGAPRLADPSRPPASFREDCRRSGREFVAWRGAEEHWQYACVDAFLVRPEVILGR